MKSFHSKMLILLLGSILAASLLIGGAGIISARQVVKEDSSQIMKLICREKTEEIDAQLLAIEQSVETIYRYADSQFIDDESLWMDSSYMEQYTEKVNDVLKNAAQSTDCAVAVYLRFNPEITSSKAGVFFSRKSEQDEFIATELTDISQYDPEDVSHVGWYYVPIANGGPTWMDPYENKNIDIEMISYIIPMYRGDTVIGVIGMDIDISLLEESVCAVTVYDSGYAFLAAANGDIIYHKDYPDGVAVEDFDEDLVELGKTIDQNKRSQEKIISYKWHGENKQMVFKKLVNGMYLIITVPSAELNQVQNGLILQCISIMLAVLGVAAVLSVKLVGQMTKPLSELTKAAEQIAKGDWNVVIRCESKDEVGVLAQTLRETIGELNRYINYINRLVDRDTMTGLYNRHYMTKYCQSCTEDKPMDLGVIFCDLNGLKYANDHYGHSAGDQLIRDFSELLKEVFPQDMCCRMSGDEFVVCAARENEQEFLERVELLRRRNREHDDHPLASIGACWEKNVTDIEELMKEAENVMYQDKECFYQEFPDYRR